MVMTTVLRFATLAILARLLSPEDFGLMGMVTVVTGFAMAFADMGLSNAIIQRQQTSRGQLSSLYWANLMAGTAICAAIFISTPLVVGFYKEPRLTGILRLAALGFLIIPFGQQFQALLQKNLQFNILARVEILAVACGSGASIGFALGGWGVYSLVLGQLINSAVRTLNLLLIGLRTARPSWHFDWRDLKDYFGFGAYQMGERAVNYFGANLDTLLIGRFLGAEALGFYSLAYRLVILPLVYINPVITRVAFPTFAKIQEDNNRLRNAYLKMMSMLSLAISPIVIGFFAIAHPMVMAFFGEKWLPSVPLIQLLAGVGLLKALTNPVGALVLAKGHADIGFKWNIVTTMVNLLVFMLVVRKGTLILAWTYLGLMLIYFFVFQQWVNRLIDLRLESYFYAIRPGLLASVTTGLLIFIANTVATRYVDGIPWIFQVLGWLVLGGALYISLAALQSRDMLAEVYSLLISRRVS